MFQLSFLNSGLLFLAAATVLPLIIWLLAKKKPPQIIFSTIRFIRKTEKEQRSRSQLKNILLLIIRMLIILLCVLAAGRPSLRIKGMKPGKTHPPTAVAIILDTSYSMDYLDNGKSVLEQAKNAVLEINKRLTPQDLVTLVTSDESWNRVNSQLFTGRLPDDLIAQIKTTWVPLSLDKLTEYANQKLKESQFSNREIYLLSDNQSQTLLANPEVPVRIIPLRKTVATENIAIVKAEPVMQLTSRQQTQLISFEIVNYGSTIRRDVLVRLDLNGITSAEKFITLQPNQKLTETLPVQIMQSGWQSGFVEVLDERLPADNRCWFSFRYDLHPDIAVITQLTSLPLIMKTFLSVYATPQGAVKLIPPSQVNWQQLKDYSVLVVYEAGEFNPRLREFLQSCTQARKGVLQVAGKDLTSGWKAWYQQQFGIRFTEYDTTPAAIDYVNSYHSVTSLLDARQLRRSSISGYWSNVVSGSASILLSSGKSALALAKDNSLLWLFDPAGSSRFYLEASFPVFAFRSLQFLNNSRLEEDQVRVGSTLSADVLTLPSGVQMELNGNPFRTYEPGIHTLSWRGGENEAIAVQPDFRESIFKPFKTPPNALYQILSARWQDELFLSRLGHDLWKYLLFIVLILFLLELILVKSEEWKKGGVQS
jgi:hypothetical protein